MKRKLASRADWKRILKRRFEVKHVETLEFSGYITFLYIDEVTTPLVMNLKDDSIPVVVPDNKPGILHDDTFCIADKGYLWMQHFPHRANYTLTTMINADEHIIQWYIDICKQHDVNEEGVPWYDDLYLDIVIAPSGAIMILDSDELDEALHEGKITQEDHDLAWRETRRILQEIEQGTFSLLQLSEEHRDLSTIF